MVSYHSNKMKLSHLWCSFEKCSLHITQRLLNGQSIHQSKGFGLVWLGFVTLCMCLCIYLVVRLKTVSCTSRMLGKCSTLTFFFSQFLLLLFCFCCMCAYLCICMTDVRSHLDMSLHVYRSQRLISGIVLSSFPLMH